MTPEWTAAVFAGVAAVIAICQIRTQISENRRQATFQHLRSIASVIQKAREAEPQVHRAEIIDYYSGKRDELPTAAFEYLAVLDELDLLGLAYEEKVVNRRIAREYLKGLLADPYIVSAAFITELRKANRDPTTYEHLLRLIKLVRAE